MKADYNDLDDAGVSLSQLKDSALMSVVELLLEKLGDARAGWATARTQATESLINLRFLQKQHDAALKHHGEEIKNKDYEIKQLRDQMTNLTERTARAEKVAAANKQRSDDARKSATKGKTTAK